MTDPYELDAVAIPPKKRTAAAPKPLTDFASGETLRVVRIDAGRGLRQRLLAMGIVPGGDVHILKTNHGPITLCVNTSRLALGRGMAAKIFARAESPAEPPCGVCEEDPSCPQR